MSFMHGNLYKIWRNRAVIGLITAVSTAAALASYLEATGRCDVYAEQLTFGYGEDVFIVYE